MKEAVNLQLYSSKHKALYMYAHRLLAPTWDMPITSYPDFTRLQEQ